MLLTGLISVFLCAVPAISAGVSDDLLEDSQVILIPADYFDPVEYMVNPGDEIWMSFPGGVPFSGVSSVVSVVSMPVGLDGVLYIPAMPGIDTYGMNLQELQSTIFDLFSYHYRGLRVSSGLARSASFQIPVTGQVGIPGIVTVNGLTRLTEAIEKAGGIAYTGAASQILVISLDGDSTVYNLNSFTTDGNLSANPLLRRDTRIHVPVAASTITIEGALSPEAGAGTVGTNRLLTEYIPGESAREALVRFGGIARTADLAGCYVYRVYNDTLATQIPFSMQGTASPVLLQPGDRVVVPASPSFINVTGEVVLAAPVAYSPGMTVSYYVGMAGGFSSLARRSSVKLQLADGERYDADMTDVVLPGSTVEVPRVPVKFWEDYLIILTGLASIVIAYQSIFSN
ncbi:MAG: SLBB domain-containing protein [Candidatus Fermentibacteraceae bacterium]|nr:SLBB domain-containing protein [Candidatus Fermentibacteraceae bacterium]